jgi:hypothetical protein
VSLARPLLKLLFLHTPKSLFQIAGIFRILNRGKKAFKKALEKEGLPDDVVDILTEEFSINLNWREIIFRKDRD